MIIKFWLDVRCTLPHAMPWRVGMGVLLAVVSLCPAASGAALPWGASDGFEACPQHAQSYPSDPAPAAQTQLVPSGAAWLLVCRYRGLNDPSPTYANTLGGTAIISDPARVASLTNQLNAMAQLVASPGTGAEACPADDGSSIVALFSYAYGTPDAVMIRPTGCSAASNGYLAVGLASAPGQQLVSSLDALTGCGELGFCDSDTLPSALAEEQRRMLLQELAPRRTASILPALLAHGDWQFTAITVSAGRLAINWYLLHSNPPTPRTLRLPALVANGHATVDQATTTRFTITLTRVGKQLLRHATGATLTARAVFTSASIIPPPSVGFTPDAGAPVKANKTFSVER